MTEPTSLKRRLAAILAADVVGYGRLMERSEVGTLERLKDRRRRILSPLLERHGGRVVKVIGDGVLVEFGSAVNAVVCAIALQEQMSKANLDGPADQAIVLRIGINVGDVIVEGSDLYGDGVNIAARLEPLAEPGGITMSPSVHDQIRGKIEINLTDMGPQTLKNVAEPLRVYRIAAPGSVSAGSVVKAAAPRPSTPAADAGKPSVAVLPFADLGGGSAGDSYFTDGIVEEIILELSRFPELLVIGRSSSFSFRDQNLDSGAIATKLGAQYVVTGSLKRAEKRIRISAQLIEAVSGANIWAERYDRELADIFDLQEELAHALAIAVAGRVTLSAADRAQRRGTENMSAYEWYLRGRALQENYDSAAATEDAAARAIALDPEFAGAHALMAFTLAIYFMSTSDPNQFERALFHASKALSLAPNDVYANVTMGFVLRYTPRYDEGRPYAARAVELNPNDTFARMMHSLYLAHADFSAGLAEMEFVLRRDPYPRTWFWDVYGMVLAAAGRYADGLAALNRDSAPEYWTHCFRAVCLHHLGQPEPARAAVSAARALVPDLTVARIQTDEPFHAPEVVERIATALLASGLPA
jgi:class 3 adenylate cyclase/TolB-like protein/Flp pilus assembly protein TadD